MTPYRDRIGCHVMTGEAYSINRTECAMKDDLLSQQINRDFCNLPTELWDHIYSQLSLTDQCNLSAANKRLRQTVNDAHHMKEAFSILQTWVQQLIALQQSDPQSYLMRFIKGRRVRAITRDADPDDDELTDVKAGIEKLYVYRELKDNADRKYKSYDIDLFLPSDNDSKYLKEVSTREVGSFGSWWFTKNLEGKWVSTNTSTRQDEMVIEDPFISAWRYWGYSRRYALFIHPLQQWLDQQFGIDCSAMTFDGFVQDKQQRDSTEEEIWRLQQFTDRFRELEQQQKTTALAIAKTQQQMLTAAKALQQLQLKTHWPTIHHIPYQHPHVVDMLNQLERLLDKLLLNIADESLSQEKYQILHQAINKFNQDWNGTKDALQGDHPIFWGDDAKSQSACIQSMETAVQQFMTQAKAWLQHRLINHQQTMAINSLMDYEPANIQSMITVNQLVRRYREVSDYSYDGWVTKKQNRCDRQLFQILQDLCAAFQAGDIKSHTVENITNLNQSPKAIKLVKQLTKWLDVTRHTAAIRLLTKETEPHKLPEPPTKSYEPTKPSVDYSRWLRVWRKLVWGTPNSECCEPLADGLPSLSAVVGFRDQGMLSQLPANEILQIMETSLDRIIQTQRRALTYCTVINYSGNYQVDVIASKGQAAEVLLTNPRSIWVTNIDNKNNKPYCSLPVPNVGYDWYVNDNQAPIWRLLWWQRHWAALDPQRQDAQSLLAFYQDEQHLRYLLESVQPPPSEILTILLTLNHMIPQGMKAILLAYAQQTADPQSLQGRLLKQSALAKGLVHHKCHYLQKPDGIKTHYHHARLCDAIFRTIRHYSVPGRVEKKPIQLPETLYFVSPVMANWLKNRFEHKMTFSIGQRVMTKMTLVGWTMLFGLRQLVYWIGYQLNIYSIASHTASAKKQPVSTATTVATLNTSSSEATPSSIPEPAASKLPTPSSTQSADGLNDTVNTTVQPIVQSVAISPAQSGAEELSISCNQSRSCSLFPAQISSETATTKLDDQTEIDRVMNKAM